ncbi:hypothetical protein [Haloarcula pellucida]|uniref:Uncharacterized protein n=1 Tax=Haloarcula pellucida TaxID=1427151 RepID=A0A830GGC3_9EURY|nr:hypothetical protein [Halomicroarcula pellucida]MBX0346821.1 hypothetical protein [Halomicroarcula pellucida]GGN85645.1 hypothetical protein GCM10009030_02410 [Halomicroarcula pellucida]
MGDYTILRVDVDAGVVARVLDAVPGVAVAEAEASTVADEAVAGTAPAGSRDTTAETECGPDADTGTEAEAPSALREWGLLGVGVSLVLLGIATVGIWWYRRRDGGDDESLAGGETPPPTTRVDRPTAEPSDEETAAVESSPETEGVHETPAPEDSSAERGESVASTVLDEEPTPEDAEPNGRTEDRSNVEWATKDARDRQTESESGDAETADEPTPRPGGSVDVAPLLGVAFLAVSGAVVRWIQDDRRDEQ